MNSLDGTAARQLDLIDDVHTPPRLERVAGPSAQAGPDPHLKLLRRDVYKELARRRRRAQIAARHALDRA
jgi:hypothetical protein